MYGDLLSRFVSSQPDMEIVGIASDGDEAVHLASLLGPHVVLMDLCMPALGGMEATRVLADTQSQIKVIALTAHREADSMRRSMEAGARAFLCKADVDAQLLATIRDVHARTESVRDTASGGEAQ